MRVNCFARVVSVFEFLISRNNDEYIPSLLPADVTFTTTSPSPGIGMGRVTLIRGLPISTTWRALCELISGLA